MDNAQANILRYMYGDIYLSWEKNIISQWELYSLFISIFGERFLSVGLKTRKAIMHS